MFAVLLLLLLLFLAYGANALLHNVGAGRFEVVPNTPVAVQGAWVENLAWIDYDGDGHLDLYANTSSIGTTCRSKATRTTG